MGAAATIASGAGIIGGALNMFQSSNEFNQSKRLSDIQSQYDIAGIMSNAENTASSMRISAIDEESNALRIRKQTAAELELFDRQASLDTGTIKSNIASSGVEFSGSALDVLVDAENAAAKQRMIRQSAGDTEAIKRERLAANLRLESQGVVTSAKYQAKIAGVNRNISSSMDRLKNTNNMINGVFRIIGATSFKEKKGGK